MSSGRARAPNLARQKSSVRLTGLCMEIRKSPWKLRSIRPRWERGDSGVGLCCGRWAGSRSMVGMHGKPKLVFVVKFSAPPKIGALPGKMGFEGGSGCEDSVGDYEDFHWNLTMESKRVWQKAWP